MQALIPEQGGDPAKVSSMSVNSKVKFPSLSSIRFLREKSMSFFLSLAFTLGLAVFLARFFLAWKEVDRGMVVRELSTEPVRLASNLFFAKMTAIGQLTVALLGATWALLLQESRIRITGASAIPCFIVTNISFFVSIIVYNIGYDFIVVRMFHHSAFDIDAPLVRMVQAYQQGFFIYGCLSLACVIYIGRQAQS